MTAYTSSQSGLASANSTWNNVGHPSANGDQFVISVGHVVTWDLDLTGLTTGLGACTINGTFQLASGGSYGAKCNGSWTWNSTAQFYANSGVVGGTYPVGSTFQQIFNGNFENTINTAIAPDIRCQEPTHTYAKLTVAALAGDTALTIDTDLTAAGDSGTNLWTNGSLVRVDNSDATGGTADSEQRTISSVSSTQLTLTAGLTNAKPIGSFVILATRNIKIIGISAAGSGNGINGGTAGYIAAEMRLLATGVRLGQDHTVGGAISNCANGLSGAAPGHTVNGVISACTQGVANSIAIIVNGLISGCATGLSVALNARFTGIVNGCPSGILGACTVTGIVKGCRSGLNGSSGYVVRNATLSNNLRDLNSVGTAFFINTLFGSATEFAAYNTDTRLIADYVESIDHDQVAGAFRAWTRGGIVTSVSSPVYDSSRVRSYQHAPESATYPVFMQRQVYVPPGGSIYVRCYVRKDSSMSYLPRLWIFSADKEPLLSGSPDSEQIMTNSIDIWEVLTATVTNSTDSPKLYIVRTLAKAASGNVYADPIIRVSSFLPESSMSMSGGMAG